jgi:hypothetical protein
MTFGITTLCRSTPKYSDCYGLSSICSHGCAMSYNLQ